MNSTRSQPAPAPWPGRHFAAGWAKCIQLFQHSWQQKLECMLNQNHQHKGVLKPYQGRKSFCTTAKYKLWSKPLWKIKGEVQHPEKSPLVEYIDECLASEFWRSQRTEGIQNFSWFKGSRYIKLWQTILEILHWIRLISVGPRAKVWKYSADIFYCCIFPIKIICFW